MDLNEYTISAEDDTYIPAILTAPKGALTFWTVGWTSGKVTDTMRGLLRFPIAGIPSDERIVEAELWAYCITAAPSAEASSIYDFGTPPIMGAGEQWVESEATWDDYSTGNAWNNPGGDYVGLVGSFNLPTTTGDKKLLDGAAFVAWLQNYRNWAVKPNFLLKRALEGVTSAMALFASNEHATQDGPRLIVRTVPKVINLLGGVNLLGNVGL